MHVHAEIGSFLSAIAQSHCGNHIALCSYAHACTASHSALALNLFPKVKLSTFHLAYLRVFLYFSYNLIDFLQFQIHDIIHYALCGSHVLLKQPVIEVSILRKRIHDIAVKVYAQQAA